MKPITEERQQALIELTTIRIGALRTWIKCNPDDSDAKTDLDVMEIALASLTAKSIGYVSNHSRQLAADGHLGYISNHEVAGLVGGYVYGAPPVPVIKLPDEFDDYGHDFDEFRRGYNACRGEIKHLNGLGE